MTSFLNRKIENKYNINISLYSILYTSSTNFSTKQLHYQSKIVNCILEDYIKEPLNHPHLTAPETKLTRNSNLYSTGNLRRCSHNFTKCRNSIGLSGIVCDNELFWSETKINILISNLLMFD